MFESTTRKVVEPLNLMNWAKDGEHRFEERKKERKNRLYSIIPIDIEALQNLWLEEEVKPSSSMGERPFVQATAAATTTTATTI